MEEAVYTGLCGCTFFKTHKATCRSGAKPMLHGFIISLLVVLVAIAVEYAIGVAPPGTL